MKKPLQLRNLGIGIATILTVIIIPSLRFLPGQVLQLALKYQESITIPARENVLFSCDTRHFFAFNTNDVRHKFWLYEYTGTETSDPASFTGRMFVWDGSKNLMDQIDFNRVIFTIREGKTYYIQSDEPMTYTCGEYLENGLHNNDPNGSSARSMQSSSARYSASDIDAACVVVGSSGRAPGEYNQSLQVLGESKHSQRAMECMMRFWAARTHNKNFVVVLKEAIKQYGHSELASVLQSITGSTDPNIRANAAHLLMFFSRDSVVATLNTLRSEDPSALVRYFATMSNYRIAGTTISEAHRRAMVELELTDAETIIEYLYRQGIQNDEIDALLYIENSPLVRIEIKNIIKRIVPDFYRSSSSGGSQTSSQTSSSGMTVSSTCTILQTGTPSTAITQAIDFLYSTAIPGTGETCISAFVMKAGTAKEHILYIIEKMKNVDLVLTTTNLITLLTHPEAEVRASAADALKNRAPSNVTDALMLRFSAEGNDTVRAAILGALKGRQGNAITDLIASKLENQSYTNLHLHIVQVLGTRYDDRSKQHLRHYLSVSTSVPFTLKQAIIAVLAEKPKEDMFATNLLVQTALAGSNIDDFVRKAAVGTLGSRAPAPGVCEALVQKSIFDVNSTIRDDAVAQYLQYAEMCKHPEDDCGDRLIMSGDSRLIEMQFDRYRARLKENANDMDAQKCMFAVIRYADDELQWDARAKALFDLAEINSPITIEALSFVIINDPYEFNRRSAAGALADRLPHQTARGALIYMRDNDPSPQLRAYAVSLLGSANLSSALSSVSSQTYRSPRSIASFSSSSISSMMFSSSRSSSVTQTEAVLTISNSVYAPTVIQKGNYIQYLVTVRNTSQTPAFNVQIKKEIPAGMTVDVSHTATNVCDVVKNEIICTKETPLSANAYWGVYIAYKIPTYNGFDVCPDIVSTATVSTSTNVSQNSVLQATSITSLDCHSSAARPDMTVTYTPTSAGNSQKGGFTQYLIRATNQGSVQAEGVKIAVEIPPGLEWDADHTSANVCARLEEPLDRRIECTKEGPLAAGQTWGVYLSFSIPATYAGNACDVNVISGVRVINALLESDASNNSTSHTMVVRCPALSSAPTVSKPDLTTRIEVSTDSRVEKGGFIQYIVHAENSGNAPAEGAKVSFNIPNGMTFNGSLSNSVCRALPSPLQNRIECSIDVIAPNSISAPTIGVDIPATFGGIACPTASTATANVSALTPESNGANNSSFIRVNISCATQSSSTPIVQPSKPDLTASINLLPTSGGYNGGMANYEVVVSNAGAYAAANVKVSFTIPNGLLYDEDYSSKKECKQLKEPLSQRIECERKDPLQAGATWSVQIGARIPRDFGGASCPNHVTATTHVSSSTLESNAANNSASNVLSIQCAATEGPLVPGLDIAVSNSYYSANSQSVSGGYHMYLIRASNVGRVTASGIVITTIIPSYYTFEPILAASSPCAVVATDKLECQYNAQIQPGKYWGVYARFRIKPEACQASMGLSAYARSLSGSEENERNNFQNANSATVECGRSLQGSLLGSVIKNAESLGTPILAPSIVEILINIVRRLMGM